MHACIININSIRGDRTHHSALKTSLDVTKQELAFASSDFVLAETPVRSPQKIYFFSFYFFECG